LARPWLSPDPTGGVHSAFQPSVAEYWGGKGGKGREGRGKEGERKGREGLERNRPVVRDQRGIALECTVCYSI